MLTHDRVCSDCWFYFLEIAYETKKKTDPMRNGTCSGRKIVPTFTVRVTSNKPTTGRL